jgi:glycosyltransferase involved in cell wall biosynthesis
VYLEAMAMEKPVVALGNGGAPEIVEHGVNGMLVDPDRPEQLAAHIATLLRSRALRARMGVHGRGQVEARFTAQRMAADFARRYDALTDGAAQQFAVMTRVAG